MDGEHAYWAFLSGLTPAQNYSVADHMVAAGADVHPPRSYYVPLSGLTPAESYSFADHKAATYAGGGPEPGVGYGLGPYGTMPYGQ